MTAFEAFYIPSTLDGQRLHVLLWAPENPVAVVQIVHGMAEHIARYDELARYLNTKNIAVIGHSHLGHGLTAPCEKDLGFFAKKNGWDHLVRDVHEVRKTAAQRFAGLPHFIYGHSMGSLVTRTYITRDFAKGLGGALIVGTVYQPSAVVAAGKMAASVIGTFCGKRHRSKFIDNASFGSSNNAFKPNRTKFDWLTRSEPHVDKYIADPFCGFCFTAGAFGDLFDGLKYIAKKGNIAKADHDLPCIFLAGERDPMGGAAGVPRIAKSFEKAGMNKIEIKLYPEDRHEIHNELDRNTVYSDVAAFIERNLA